MFIFGFCVCKVEFYLTNIRYKANAIMINRTTITLKGKALKLMISAVFCCGLNLGSHAQLTTLTNQDKISDFLGNDRFNDLLSSNPSYLTFLDARCSNGYKIIDMPLEKTTGMTVLNSIVYEEWLISEKSEEEIRQTSEIELTPEEFVENSASPEFNILKYHFNFDKKEMVYYVLGATGKVIMIYPIEFINQKAN